jgi:C-terminal processing protease CtpA/Prc
LDNVILVGDTTGGGLGMPNGGQLPNGWTYRFSVTQTLDLNGNNWENGVPPDVLAILSPADVANGKDSVIEKAIEELRKP